MTTHGGTMVWRGILMGATLLLCIGCEDAEALRQTEIQEALDGAEEALAGARVAAELDPVLRTIEQIRGGTDAQQARQSMLAATALLRRAEDDLAAAHRHETQLGHRVSELRTRLRLATALATRAEHRRQAYADLDYAGLEQQRTSALRNLRQLGVQLAEIAEPIAGLEIQNTEAAARIEALRRRTEILRQRAAELGHADGFTIFEGAVMTRREADALDFGLAMRELVLELDLRLEHAHSMAQTQGTQALLEEIRHAVKRLDAVAEATARSVEEGRFAALEVARGILADLDGFADEDAVLASHYREADATLQRATVTAEQAVRRSRGDSQQVASLATLRTWDALGRMHGARARGLANRLHLLGSLAAQIPGEQGVAGAARIDALEEDRQAAVDQARAAWTRALEIAGTLRSNQSGVEATLQGIRLSLERSLVSLESGVPGPLPEPIPQAPPPVAGGTTSTPSGFDSPQDLCVHLAGLGQGATNAPTEAIEEFLALSHVTTPEAIEFKKLLGAMSEATRLFSSAMVDVFGPESLEIMADTGITTGFDPPVIDLDSIRVTSETTAEARREDPLGGPNETLWMILIDGRWFVDGDRSIEETRDELEPLRQMAPVITAVGRDFTRRIRAGEFATAADAAGAYGQAIMMAMMGGLGGGSLPGPPR